MSGKKVVMLYRKEFEPNPVLYRQSQTLLKNGYKVKIIAWDRRKEKPKKELMDGIEIENIAIKCGYGSAFHLLVKVLFYYLRVFKILTKENFDILHCHDIHTAPAGIIITKLLNKKIIYDVHDFYFRGGQLLEPILHMIDNFFASKAGFILVPSPYFQEYYKKINDKVIVIFNAPEKDVFIPRKIPIKNNHVFTISYFGNVRWDKQLVDLMEATKEIEDVEVFIGGGGIKMEKIRETVKNYNHVRMGGFVAYKELVKRYWQSDCIYVVYPPNDQAVKYSIPMKIFEAMACGIPVIVDKKGRTGKFVKENNVGLCVEEGDLQQIKDAITKLRDDLELRKKMGENGRQLVEEFYNWEKMEKRLLNVYENLEK